MQQPAHGSRRHLRDLAEPATEPTPSSSFSPKKSLPRHQTRPDSVPSSALAASPLLADAVQRAVSLCLRSAAAAAAICDALSPVEVEAALRGALDALAAAAAATTRALEAAATAPGAAVWDAPAAVAAAAVTAAWGAVHTGPWRDTPQLARHVYAAASAIAAGVDAARGDSVAALRTLDIALMLAAPEDRDALLVYVAALGGGSESADAAWRDLAAVNTAVSSSRCAPPLPHTEVGYAAICGAPTGVPRLTAPSLQTFNTECMRRGEPAVIAGAMDDWPALVRWPRPEYLARVAGARTVPVEVGGDYMAARWGTRLCTLREFIECAVAPAGSGGPSPVASAADAAPAYLAQHALFDQVPALLADIRVPDYTALDARDEPSIKAWYGPAATVSRLHFDAPHNLLAQVVGSKRVRLFPPAAGSGLYPHPGAMGNTSAVDPEAPPTAEAAPRFACDAAPLERIVDIHPGDMLYIPPGWWHHVRALEVSFSVSFWW